VIRNTVRSVVMSALLVAVPALAQDAPPPAPDQQAAQSQTASPEHLDDLVAPIALYPDSLLSQMLVASTYPLELVEANQWLAQNGSLQGQARIDGAQQQNWDASVQALVAFPDVIKRMTQDVRWTTDLGNAFLAQEGDVMSAVQRMRQRAQQAGKLNSTPQQVVNMDNTQGGEPVIEIQPADPQMVYVPTYNPVYIWGPPVYGYYPPLYYPSVGFGFGFGGGIAIGAFFGGWGGGWAGWGWGPSWHNRTIIVNNNFFHRYRFNDSHDGRFAAGSAVWSHDPGHRLAVPYANREVNDRFRGSQQQNSFGRNAAPQTAAPRGFSGNTGGNNFGRAEAPRPQAQPAPQRFGTPQFEQHNSGGSHSAFGGVQEGGRTRVESDHGFSSMGRSAPAQRSAPAPRAAAPSHSEGGRRR
jgi:hypothetical protein